MAKSKVTIIAVPETNACEGCVFRKINHLYECAEVVAHMGLKKCEKGYIYEIEK